MDGINWLDLFTALDRFLLAAAHEHGGMAYGLLFAIVFAETALVFMAFLPGDSLLFIAGAISASGALQAVPLAGTVVLAATLGNIVNFAIGAWLGHKIYDGSIPWIDRRALDRTHRFFERHGGKTLIAARFLPLMRSVAPLVAGASGMARRDFHLYSFTGAVLWSIALVGGGYLFGNVAVVRDHLGIVLLIGLGGAFGALALAGLVRAAQSRRGRRA